MTDVGVGVPSAADDKPWWQSKTIIGTGIAMLATVVQLVFHKTISVGDQTQVADLIMSLIQVGGGFLAVIGRLTASKDLK